MQNMQKEKKYSGGDAAISILLSLLLLSGAADLFGDFIPQGGGPAFLAAGFVTAALVILSQQRKTLEVVLPLLLLSGAFVLLFFRMEAVIEGILVMVDAMLERWNTVFDAYLPLYGLSGTAEGDMLPAAVILGVLLGLFTGYAVWRRWLGALTVAVFLLLAAGCLLQGNLSAFPVLFFLAGWLGVWSGSQKGSPHSRVATLPVCACTLAVGLGVSFFLSGYEAGEVLLNARKTIETAVQQCRYGKDTLPKGDLGRAGQLFGRKEDSEKETLELSFDQAGEMYLRGFVGAEYDGKSWKQLPNDAYTGNQEGMLEWLLEQGYDPLFPAASLEEKTSGDEDSAEHEMQTVTVVNRGADRRYVYVPEIARSAGGTTYRRGQDWQLRSRGFFGVNTWEFESLASPWDLLSVVSGQFSEELRFVRDSAAEAEQVYRSFAYSHYLSIDEDVRDTIDRLFFSGESWQAHAGKDTVNLYDAAARIRVMLSAFATYAPWTEEVPEGEDFVTWFLEEHKEGTSVHFATAAVLAYRTLGIPARYVEGYFLNRDLAEQLNEEEADSCILTRQNSHAWVEIYVDGAGWYPVEVTPGFYREIYSPDYLIDIEEEEVENADGRTRVEADELLPGTREKEEDTVLAEIPWNAVGIVLLVILLFLGICLLLEGQRSVRLFLRDRKRRKNPERLAGLAYGQMCGMLRHAGFGKDFGRPYALTEQIHGQFPSIKEEEYLRVIQIIQKNVFGQKTLYPNECRILDHFCRKLRTEIYRNASLRKKLLYRYMYCH